MKADVLDGKGNKLREVELPAKIFAVEVNRDLMHQAYVRQMSNARLGTHDTKVRSEVSGGGRKPWKQKGTGRARQGSTRAAQWVGGGRIHTPHPRSYELKMPKKMRQAALRSALSVKAADKGIVVVEDLEFRQPKTSHMVEMLFNLVGDSSVLVLMPARNKSYETALKSAHNIKSAKILLAGYLNVRDLLGYEKILLPMKALDAITAHLG